MKLIILPFALLLPFATSSHSTETIPANEEQATRTITEEIENIVRNEAYNKNATRDAHVKSHGCLKATFKTLDNIPETLKIGVFKSSNEYPAWIRFSNASGKSQNDQESDARGMAIKLMGVQESESTTQDFLMINNPVFLVRNASDYVEFTKSVSKGSPLKFFFPSWLPWNFRIHELLIGRKIQTNKITNPLTSRFWSTTPYLFDKTQMKFSALPCTKNKFSSQNEMTKGANILRDNIQATLESQNACFYFAIQLRNKPSKMPIEDPTIEWKEKDSPFIKVAMVHIERQKFTERDQIKFCEELSFTPWHTIPEFRPLGGINRVRRAVYDTVSRVRHEINGIQRQEPNGF